jgi:sigma-E factor negative regulatory protein RseC
MINMQEEGKVVEVSGNIARVKITIGQQCKECSACGHAGISSEIFLNAHNIVNAQVGQKVRLETRLREANIFNILIFLLTTFGLLAGVLSGTYITTLLGYKQYSELCGCILGIVAGVCIFTGMYYMQKYLQKKYPVISKVVEIIE